MKRLIRWGAVLALVLAWAPAAQARGLELGLLDASPFEGADGAAWYQRAAELDAGMVRLGGTWAAIAPVTRSTLRDARDPAHPAYRWTRLDNAVRGAAAAGLQVMLTLSGAPSWAEGANRQSSARAGSWRPDPAAFADFVQVAARRYDGSFPDPLRPGATLPRVRYWQPWNEPNLPTHLSPQWSGNRPLTRPASPAWYRRMLNAAYPRIKAVHSTNFVIAAGTAPYGDPQLVGNRMTPVAFMRELLCLRGAALRRMPCANPARFDAIDHHPYATGSPTDHALLPENVAIPDLPKLTRILRVARQRRTVRPAGGKQVWITEISWDSRPPDPDGVPEERRARWLQDSFYSLWRQGASRIFWFLLRDQPPVPSFNQTYQSGLYTVDGEAKLSAKAFRLPFVARRTGRSSKPIYVWGRSPITGPVAIERRRGEVWSRIGTVRPTSGAVFEGRVAAPAGAVLRARAGEDVSLPTTVR